MRGLTILPLLALMACNEAVPGNAAAPAATPAAGTGAVAQGRPSPAPSAKAGANEVEVETADYSFAYSYPAQAAAIPALKSWLDGEREKLRAALIKETSEARKEAEGGGFAFAQYDSATAWAVVTETPRLLSMSADVYSYTGGAHGTPGTGSLVWDKTAGKRLASLDLFASPAALEAVIGAPFCRELNKERAKRRGEPVTGSDEPFDTCPKLEQLTLILGSRRGNAIDRIGLLADPYVAGPYVEGGYEVTLPVTAAVVKAVKPEYRGAFGIQ